MATQVAALEKFMRPPQNVGANDVKPQPVFAGFQKPSVDMEAVRDGRRAPLLYLDVPLDSTFTIAAGNPVVLPLSGNSFYIDQDTSIVGNAVVHFQDTNLQTASAPIYVGAGFIAKVPFTQLLIENKTAQAGKKLRIIYGTDVDFTAGVNATLTISSQAAISNSSDSANFSVTTSSQTLVAANPTRKYLWIQNQSTTATLAVRFGAGAASLTTGFLIPPSGTLTLDNNINTNAVQIIGSASAAAHYMEG
jgi:hypothetical protein